MAPTIFSPLAAGLLTGKYNAGIPADSRAALDGYEWIKGRITPERIAQIKQLQDDRGGAGLLTGATGPGVGA